MPELPEVEIYRRYFEAHALHQKIAAVVVHDRGVLASPVTPGKLASALVGHRFETVRRHGKNLFAEISGNGFLRIHFGMTGDLAYFHHPYEAPRFGRVEFRFENGASLSYDDSRKFGRIDLVQHPQDYLSRGALGPDPLAESFLVPGFVCSIAGRRGAIKPLLLNQRILAGVGNLYADEALFQAGIHPRARVEQVGPARLSHLFKALTRILRNVIEIQKRDQPYPRTYLLPRREEGKRCPRCGGRIARATVGGRTTYFCTTHQRLVTRRRGDAETRRKRSPRRK